MHATTASAKPGTLFARQGDIALIHSDRSTDGKKRVEPVNGELTLGHGSATGHRHGVLATDAEMYEDGADLLLVVNRPTRMLHPEHGVERTTESGEVDSVTNVIPEGIYTVRRQREQFGVEEIQYVQD
jgi:hypothetical protein